MMKRAVVAIVLLIITIALYLVSRPAPLVERPYEAAKPAAQPTGNNVSAPAISLGGEEKAVETPSKEKQVLSGQPEASVPPQSFVDRHPGKVAVPPLRQPIEEITSPSDELDNVQLMVRGYRDVLGENPFGNNLEITKALMGQNAKQVKMPLPVGSHLNESGELSDRWGTPYFFHQLSAKDMEVRSAGPDQQMWTKDDLVTR